MKILIDMNLSPQWCQVLEQHGFTCSHWSQVGDPKATDSSIMEWASQNEFIIFTHDLDFGAIPASTQASGPSVIQVRTQDVMPGALEQTVVKLLQKHQTEIVDGALIIIDETKSRIRILPLNQ